MAVGSHIPMESVGKLESERKGGKDKRMSLLEEVLNRANIERAIKAVMANKGAFLMWSQMLCPSYSMIFTILPFAPQKV